MRSDAPAAEVRRGTVAAGGAAAWYGAVAEASQVLLAAHVRSARHDGGPMLCIADAVAIGLCAPVNHRRRGLVIFGCQGPCLPLANWSVADWSLRAATTLVSTKSAAPAYIADVNTAQPARALHPVEV